MQDKDAQNKQLEVVRSEKLLCFPLSMQIAKSQIKEMVDLGGLYSSDRNAFIKRELAKESDLLSIVNIEESENVIKAVRNSVINNRRRVAFFTTDFFAWVLCGKQDTYCSSTRKYGLSRQR